MTGRDLIIYILENGLEDKPVYEDGKVLGLMTTAETAEKFNVGMSTVLLWVQLDMLPGVMIGKELYIPATAHLRGVKDV